MRISPGLRSIRQVRRASILAVCLQLLIHIGCKQNSPPTTPDAPAHESGWINASIEGVEQSFLEYQMLSAVSFSDANHGTAVGSNGISLHTTDGGKRWTLQPTGTWYDLAGVCQIDSTTAYAVGAENAIYGIVLGTTNGGLNWVDLSFQGLYRLGDVSFKSGNTGHAVGDQLLHTTNGGKTWTKQKMPPGVYSVDAVSFADDFHGWAVGFDGAIIHTSDGGDTWEKQYGITTKRLTDVCFTDTMIGVIVGNGGIILRTTDGGGMWMEQSSGTTEGLNGVSFTDARTGTVVGGNGIILRTTNGGATWARQESGTKETLWGVHFIDARTGIIIGGTDRIYGGKGALILRTTTGGDPK